MPEEVIVGSEGAALAPPAPSPAPASDSAPAAQTSLEKAVAAKDFTAFQHAKHPELFKGRKAAEPSPTDPTPEPLEPEPEPEPKPSAASAPTGERQLSKRQIDTNEAIRKAVESATATLQAEVDRLKLKGTAEPRRDAAPVPALEADPEPNPADEAKYPEGRFDTKFIKDLSSWQTRQDLHADRVQQAARDQQREAVTIFHTQVQQARDRVQTAIKADPKALEGVDLQIFGLRPSIALKPGEPSTFGNIIADWVLSTEHPVQLAKHLSDRAEVSRLANLSPRELLKEQGRIEARLTPTANATDPSAPAPPAKTITAASDPAHTLGSRPVEAPDAIEGAVREKNFTAYQQAKRAKGVLHYTG